MMTRRLEEMDQITHEFSQLRRLRDLLTDAGVLDGAMAQARLIMKTREVANARERLERLERELADLASPADDGA